MENIEGKQIIVIGGAGFVGSHLCEFLCCENSVLSIDNYLSGSENNHVDRVTYIKGSSLNISDLAADFSPDIIFHLGEFSRVESSYERYDLIIDNNLIPFTAVLNYAREKNAKLIYSGSSTKFAHYPVGDSQSPYAWVKKINTEHLINFSSWFGLDYAIVYFYNVYGGNEITDGQFSTVIGKFKKLVSEGATSLPVVKPGHQLRNFTHYSDIISGLVAVALKGSGDGFGIGSDRAVAMLDIVKFLKCTPHYIPARRGNRMSADLVTSATRELGWRPKIDIEDHLAEFLQKY